jgi:hypothetical protein
MSKSPSQIPAQVVRKVGPDLETVLQHILSGQSVYPSRIVCFDPGEDRPWDATSDVADARAQRADSGS